MAGGWGDEEVPAGAGKHQKQCRVAEKRSSNELARPEGKSYVLARRRGTEESQTMTPTPIPDRRREATSHSPSSCSLRLNSQTPDGLWLLGPCL